MNLDQIYQDHQAQFNWLEDDGHYARWEIEPGISEWFCTICGEQVDDPSEGCPECETEERL